MDDRSIREMLGDDIRLRLNEISHVDPDGKEVENLTKLISTYDAMRKTEADIAVAEKTAKTENIFKWVNAGIGIGGIVIPLIAYVGLSMVGFHLEETGSVSGFTLKNVFQKLGPKK